MANRKCMHAVKQWECRWSSVILITEIRQYFLHFGFFLGCYFKRPNSRLTRSLACNRHYCTLFIATRKTARALCSVRRDIKQRWLMCKYYVIYKTQKCITHCYPSENDWATATGNMLKNWWSGAQFTTYLTTILRLSYDNAKVTIDLR